MRYMLIFTIVVIVSSILFCKKLIATNYIGFGTHKMSGYVHFETTEAEAYNKVLSSELDPVNTKILLIENNTSCKCHPRLMDLKH